MSPSSGDDPGQATPLILGLGSPHGDDQLGWIAADRLRRLLPEGITVAKASGGSGVLQSLGGHDELVIVDALAPSGRPGTVRSFAWPCEDLVALAPWSSHGLGVVEALRFAEILGRLPRRVTIETVEAQSVLPGAGLSRHAARGLDELVGSLLERFRASGTGGVIDGGGSCTKRR